MSLLLLYLFMSNHAEVTELLKVTNKITVCAEDTNGLKTVTNEWTIDNMIQKKPQISTICWWRKYKWECRYNIFSSKKRKEKKFKSCWENNALMYKFLELNSRKHAHSFEHSFTYSTNIYEATTHTTLYINL